jgi:hypothetical protein
LVGTVQQIGAALQGKLDIKEGDRVIPIYSLSSIPIKLTSIDNVMGTDASRECADTFRAVAHHHVA